MASLWAQYKLEREGVQTLERLWGFASYLMNKDECYIQDIYIVPAMRRAHSASDLADEVAKIALENGCKTLTGTVNIESKEATTSLKVLLGYGMKLSHVKDNMIVFYKDLGE